MHACTEYEYARLIAVMHPTGCITSIQPLYMASESLLKCIVFRHFWPLKESITLNLAQRLFRVIHFGGNRKPVYDFISVT